MRYSSHLSIDFSFLASNFQMLRQLAPQNDVIFMIKANAYGHGIDEVTRFALSELGIRQFGVASIGEAMGIRQRQPDLLAELTVFSETEICNSLYHECYTDYRITPVIHNLDHLEYFLSKSEFKFLPLVLKFDTGMHRLGIPYNAEALEKVVQLLKQSGRREVEHLMTHFSSSNIPLKENDRTHRQYNNFLEIKKFLKSNGVAINKTSCANSGAIEQKFALEETHIRPGLMLYGPTSVGGFKQQLASSYTTPWSGKSISKLTSPILTITPVKKGTPIGYGAHVCHKDGIIVNLPIGYGDGFLTYYSGIKLQHKKHEYQVLGRVNMDLISLLFDTSAANDLKIGDEINLWDHDTQSVSDLATQAKTIPYQVYTAITNRVPRTYHVH